MIGLIIALTIVGGVMGAVALAVGMGTQDWSAVYGGVLTLGLITLFWLGVIVGRNWSTLS